MTAEVHTFTLTTQNTISKICETLTLNVAWICLSLSLYVLICHAICSSHTYVCLLNIQVTSDLMNRAYDAFYQ